MSSAAGEGSDKPTDDADTPPLQLEEVVLEPLRLDDAPVHEKRGKRVEDTRSWIAIFLLAILAFVLGSLLLMLYQGRLAPDEFSGVAGVVLAPIVGLLGAATGYYYGRTGNP